MVDKPLGKDEHGGLLVQWDHELLRMESQLRTSLPYETEEDRLGVLAIYESECVRGENVIGSEFDLSDYIAGPCFIAKGDSGELIPAVRCLLLGPHQQPISFVSMGILRSLKQIADAKRSLPPWDPPVRVKLRQVPCRGGRTYKLTPVTNGGK